MISATAWAFSELDGLLAQIDIMKWILPAPILVVLLAIPKTRRNWSVRNAAAFYAGYFIAGVTGLFYLRFILGHIDGKFRDPTTAFLLGTTGMFFFAADSAISFLVGLVFVSIIRRIRLSPGSWRVSLALGIFGALVEAVAYPLFGETGPYSLLYLRWINTWLWGYPLVCALVLFMPRLRMPTSPVAKAPVAAERKVGESEHPEAQLPPAV